jgi:hypothetical protein
MVDPLLGFQGWQILDRRHLWKRQRERLWPLTVEEKW